MQLERVHNKVIRWGLADLRLVLLRRALGVARCSVARCSVECSCTRRTHVAERHSCYSYCTKQKSKVNLRIKNCTCYRIRMKRKTAANGPEVLTSSCIPNHVAAESLPASICPFPQLAAGSDHGSAANGSAML